MLRTHEFELPTVETLRPDADDLDSFEFVDTRDDESIISTTLPVNARSCYELFCDVARIPEWVANVRSVQILGFDDAGRVTRAAFLSSIGRVSAGYTLEYRYDDADMRVLWSTPAGTMTQLSGRASFIPLSDRATMMHYQLRADLPTSLGLVGMPGGHAASNALNDFRDYVSRRFAPC